MAEDSKQVVLEDADGVQTFVQPEVFDGRLVLAVQHESGSVVRHALDSKQAQRLQEKNPDVKALVDVATAAAKKAGVPTAPDESAELDRVIAALKKAGFNVVPSTPAEQPAV